MVHRVDQGERSWIELSADEGCHAVRGVAETEASVGIGEADRAARAGMAEGAGVGTERERGTGQHKTETQPGGVPNHDVGAVRLLRRGTRQGFRTEETDTVDLPTAGERTVDARHRTGVRVTVGRRNLRR